MSTVATAKTSGRPASGYKNAAGDRIPGVTTIIGRFKESGGLIQWAYKCGRDGIDINKARDAAADAGTCCHQMIDDHLHGRPFNREAWDDALLAKADHAFLAFLEWQETTKVQVAAAEVSLVSERHQFGGTFDAVTVGGNKLRLLDYKTSNGIYHDMLIQVAGGYSLLWQEHHPAEAIEGIQLLRISKPEHPDDPISFHHHYWSAELIPLAQRQFLLLREAYDLDRRLKKMV